MDIPEYQEPNYAYRVKELLKTVDGDTIDVLLDMGFESYQKKRLRFLQMNAWEKYGKHKDKGIIAKVFLQRVLESADEIVVQTVMDAKGKYGRVLAWVWIKEGDKIININAVMVEDGHARETK